MSEPRDSTRTYADFDIRSPFRSYFRVGRNILVEPETFFRTVRGGGLWGPTGFVFATYLLVSILVAPVFLLGLVLMISRITSLGPSGADSIWSLAFVKVAAPLLAPVLTPFGGVLGTFVGAVIWHPFVALSVGVGRGAGFRETYRIAAYQSLPYVVANFIPLIGILLAVGGMSYVGVFGVKAAHGTTTTRAIISVAVPLVATFLLFVVALVAVFTVSLDRSS